MGYYWLYIPALVCFLLPIINGIYKSRKEARLHAFRIYYAAEERCSRAMDSRSISVVQNAIDEWQSAFQEAEPVLDANYRHLFEVDIADLKTHLADIEEDDWLKKAEKYLDSFSECYMLIVNGDMETFRDVDRIFALKKRCISAWQKYFSVDLEPYRTTIYPKRYLREYMGELYDPCMESHDALEKKLSDYIQTARPEYRRKMRLFELLVAYVRNRESVLRAELMKAPFDGFTADEVKVCYKALLEKNRLTEYKMGSRLFVMLSDKETAKSVQ